MNLIIYPIVHEKIHFFEFSSFYMDFGRFLGGRFEFQRPFGKTSGKHLSAFEFFNIFMRKLNSCSVVSFSSQKQLGGQ